MDSVWRTDVASLDYVAEVQSYYALVKATEDRNLVFFTSNGQHCTVDRQNGQIIEKGQDDDVLKEFECLVPLKLVFIDNSSPSTVVPFTQEELREFEKQEEELDKEAEEFNKK